MSTWKNMYGEDIAHGDRIYYDTRIPCLVGKGHRVKEGQQHCWMCGVILPEVRHSTSVPRLIKRDGGWQCYYCRTPFDERPYPASVKPRTPEERRALDRAPSIDHVIPKSRGGSNRQDNKVLACRLCNQAKADRTLDEWRALGFPKRVHLRDAVWLQVAT